MVVDPKEPGRIRRFFARIRNFLTPRQFRKVRSDYKKTTGKSPPPISRDVPPSIQPSTGPSRPPAPSGAPSRSASEVREEQRRIEELRRIEEEARRERESLETKVAAQEPPIRELEGFQRRTGFVYSTYFKAFGTIGDLADMGDSPTLLGDMTELEDMDVPAAFYSSAKLGKVKWKGVRERESLIQELGDVAFQGSDFRDIYPRWEYRYYVAEMVGNVTVQIFEHKARQPLSKEARRNGYKAN